MWDLLNTNRTQETPHSSTKPKYWQKKQRFCVLLYKKIIKIQKCTNNFKYRIQAAKTPKQKKNVLGAFNTFFLVHINWDVKRSIMKRSRITTWAKYSHIWPYSSCHQARNLKPHVSCQVQTFEKRSDKTVE